MKELLKNKNLRRSALFGALAITVVATVVSGHEKPSAVVAGPAERAAAQVVAMARPDAAPAEDFDLDALRRERSEGEIAELFKADAPPAPPAAPGTAMVGATARPAEPPLPFQYLGRVVEDGRTSVFLARGDESLVVRQGQSVDGQYRVDEVTDASIAFTHLPSGARKVLAISARN